MRLALLLAFLPPATVTLACNCPDTGSPVELSYATVARNPKVSFTGDATLECVRRDAADRCSAYWIVPRRKGTVTFTLLFDDGTTSADTIEYVDDTEYPCRGNIRPVRDHITSL